MGHHKKTKKKNTKGKLYYHSYDKYIHNFSKKLKKSKHDLDYKIKELTDRYNIDMEPWNDYYYDYINYPQPLTGPPSTDDIDKLETYKKLVSSVKPLDETKWNTLTLWLKKQKRKQNKTSSRSKSNKSKSWSYKSNISKKIPSNIKIDIVTRIGKISKERAKIFLSLGV